jgi:proline iminopeptidase
MQQFGQEMASRRRPEDDAARAAIEASDAFRDGHAGALEEHQLNTFLPFFRDRANARPGLLGFTEITAANVQAGPERMMGSLGALDPMHRYAGISCPTLVVHAELDPIPLAWSRLLADTIPGADLAVVEGANHFAHVEDPGRLRAAVVPWLRGLD